jgi:ring-1,2-phenylacetyl-CoA epoxidase subunit PaaC
VSATPVTSALIVEGLPVLARYALALGDDALVLGQRLGEWLAQAPQLEEDLALANISLDLLGQARTLLSYAGEVERAGHGEDDFAYWRDDNQFRNVHLVEQPNGDFAVTMARQLVFAAYQYELYLALTESGDASLAALAAKAVKEVTYHRQHARTWVVRLGDGTEESHRRMQAGVEAVWPFVPELFEPDEVTVALPSVAVDPSTLEGAWARYVDDTLAEATLTRPTPRWRSRGGRAGLHSEHLGHLLAPMQHLHRSHPGATW